MSKCPWAPNPKSLLKTSLVACAMVFFLGGGCKNPAQKAIWMKVLHKYSYQNLEAWEALEQPDASLHFVDQVLGLAWQARHGSKHTFCPSPSDSFRGSLWHYLICNPSNKDLPRGKSQSMGHSDPAPQLGPLARNSFIWIKDDPDCR